MSVRMDKESYELGYQDGADNTRANAQNVSDKLAYESGRIEGKAAREQEYSQACEQLSKLSM